MRFLSIVMWQRLVANSYSVRRALARPQYVRTQLAQRMRYAAHGAPWPLNTLRAEPCYVNWAASAEFNRERACVRIIDSRNEPLPRIFCRITRGAQSVN